jgi:hypothetical protein
VDSHTEVAKEKEISWKAIVVCGRRQERQDGTLKRRRSSREDTPVIESNRREASSGIPRRRKRSWRGGTNPIGPYGDAGETLKDNQSHERLLEWRRRGSRTLLFTRTFEGKNNKPKERRRGWG